MKAKYFLTISIVIIGLSNVTNAQNVNIPDTNFKSALVGNHTINTNADGEIQVSEAAAFSGIINVNSVGISDLKGIEAFTALTQLECANNQLTSLNISSNIALTNLTCSSNQLTSLDVSTNNALTFLQSDNNQLTSLNVSGATALISTDTALAYFDFGDNQLSTLDISTNTKLKLLWCYYNQLTSLNLSSNTALTDLYCSGNKLTSLNLSTNIVLTYLNCLGNKLTSLDLSANMALMYLLCHNNQLTSLNAKNGNNANFINFVAINNPNLTCIQVDNVAYSNTSQNWFKDSTASYSQNCTTGIAMPKGDIEMLIYPNPTNGSFSIKPSTTDKQTIDLYDVNGRHVFNTSVDGAADIIANSLDNGIYTLTIKNSSGLTNKKLVITR
jgi:Leucine-rich repeat (LRR) protein